MGNCTKTFVLLSNGKCALEAMRLMKTGTMLAGR